MSKVRSVREYSETSDIQAERGTLSIVLLGLKDREVSQGPMAEILF